MIIFFPVTFVYRRSLATLAVSREGGGGEGEGLLQEVFYQNSLLHKHHLRSASYLSSWFCQPFPTLHVCLSLISGIAVMYKRLRIDCLKVALSGELLLLSARLARALVSLLLVQLN